MTFLQHFGLELFGTFLLVLLGNGVVANILLKNTKGNGQGFFPITAGWGFAVMVGAMCASLLGGQAQLNPAVTLGFIIQHTWFDTNGWDLVAAFLLGQIVGAILAQIVVDIFYWKHMKETLVENPEFVLAMHSTGPTHRNVFLNLFAEFIGTFVLVAAIMSTTKIHDANISLGPWGPIFVGLVVFSVGISLGGTTGYAINPVRDLAPRIVHALLPMKGKGKSDWTYSWIPVIGPLSGGAVAGLIFMLV